MNLSPIKCAACGEENARNADRCEHCTRELGFVNVNIYSDPHFQNGLKNRYQNTLKEARTPEDQQALADMEQVVQDQSHALINLNFDLLRKVVLEKQDYLPYQTAVLQDKRPKASFLNDKDRCVVEAAFYGIDGGRVVYAALALNDIGLSSYGKITMILKTKSIEERTTVFERNTFPLFDDFVAKGWPVRGPIPAGYSGTWHERGQLVVCKHGVSYLASSPKPKLDAMLLCVGTTRNDDEFIELHIFNKLNRLAVQRIVIHEAPKHAFDLLQLDILKTEAQKIGIEVIEK
jgi:hypothetical protein